MDILRIARSPTGVGWFVRRLSSPGGNRPVFGSVSALDCVDYVVELQLMDGGEELTIQIVDPCEFARELFDREANETAAAMRHLMTPG